MSSSFDALRSAIFKSGSDSRVEVNQRALIDKILARYASAGAVYRELLQNSNDAEASTAEILITTKDNGSEPVVTQVVYRNDGLPFRSQDWSRLRKIAEGNPDVSKVGAFGVGAYTMFSICEQPMVISAGHALAFAWKGDALWTKTAKSPYPVDQWTTFVLPSRDPYSLPDLVKFGQFLCASLTFTQHLNTINLYVDNHKRLSITKTQVKGPTIVTPPKATSWWNNDGAITRSPNGIFSLKRRDEAITETVNEVLVTLDGDQSRILARYVSAIADVMVPDSMERRIFRVTKKSTPPHVNIQVFIDAVARTSSSRRTGSKAIIDSFSPEMGGGRVFIGFKTSQTTGIAAHLAAPLIPTVEREAIDFQNDALRVYNTELLSIAGIVMRLTLEHSMGLIGERWQQASTSRNQVAEEQKNRSTHNSNDGATSNTSNSEVGSNSVERVSEGEEERRPTGLFGFARFMVGGVKKIADVISAIDPIGSGDDYILNPNDPVPLSSEEQDAVMLMRAFCPRPSTPDPLVGSVIAAGFAACMPNSSPPVLTISGILRGSTARLPFKGIEAFVKSNVVRRVVLRNAEEYHRHVAVCPKLSYEDLVSEAQARPFSNEEVVRLIKWVAKFFGSQSKVPNDTIRIKRAVRISPAVNVKEGSPESSRLLHLRDFEYYLSNRNITDELPLPARMLPKSMRSQLPLRFLEDPVLSQWFTPLPFRVWLDFIIQHTSLTEARAEDHKLRIRILCAIWGEYRNLGGDERTQLGKTLHSQLAHLKCIPYDDPRGFVSADIPGDLYLPTAELHIFEGLGSFRKVSASLRDVGIGDNFLVAIGVRKAISIDFLFTQLDTLRWSKNPKPLIAYLRKATLTSQDLAKLKQTQYLPEVRDKSRTYAPSELYLPHVDLNVFPFVKILQWPSNEPLHEGSPDWKFLLKLGCMVNPPLESVLKFMANENTGRAERSRCLKFVYKRLLPGGPYEVQYKSRFSRSSADFSNFLTLKFLPVVRLDPLEMKTFNELQAPNTCFTDISCGCMGFPILDAEVDGKNGRLFGNTFQCRERPPTDALVHRLLNIASISKSRLNSGSSASSFGEHVLQVFRKIFDYLSTRANEFGKKQLEVLAKAPFIPLMVGESIEWFHSRDVYFKTQTLDGEELTAVLFRYIDFNPFLATIGVRAEASVKDLLEMMLSDPQKVLEKLGGEEKYRTLLRRIAANPPFRSVSKELRATPFLLAYQLESDEVDEIETQDTLQTVKARYTIAKAEDICIIDNSFFARMFNVLSAPQESDLEDFYARLGAKYISQRIEKSFEVTGGSSQGTPIAKDFARRVNERRPLLVSANVTSRPLRRKAADLLDERNLRICEAQGIRAHYTLGKTSKSQKVTCCAKAEGKGRNALFVTRDLDWFDVGNAVGGLILQRCQLEDAFFVGNLLEAPLAQLRSRGFPVDRILKADTPVQQKPKPSPIEREGASAQPQGQRESLSLKGSIQGNSSETKGGGAELGKSSSQSERRWMSRRHSNSPELVSDKQGFHRILQDMFPDCSPEYISSLLGPEPSLEKLKEAKEILEGTDYPRKVAPKPAKDEKFSRTASGSIRDIVNPITRKPISRPTSPRAHETKDPLSKRGNIFGRVFNGIRNPARGPSHLTPGTSQQTSRRIAERNGPVSSEQDAAAHRSTEQMLEDSAHRTRNVSRAGFQSPERIMTSIPAELDRHGDGCEVVPAQNLVPFSAAASKRLGIQVFSFRHDRDHSASEQFLRRNIDAIRAFRNVLFSLAEVYSIRSDGLAIYFSPVGRTIAFNRQGGLYFNLRYFTSLHYRQGAHPTVDCYCYWFTTMAHELAHNLVSPHNKEHGYYTESYVSKYLPNLVQSLATLQTR
ncbi:Histidine kinase/HSP90-like ATPase [Gracilaria domingensis]|nr:Histidine kinase/HSP90-like ATPase [Gracilaria domingensis]